MKHLTPNSYFVHPFKAFKGFSYTYAYLGGSNSPLMTVDEAIAPTGNWVWPDPAEPYNVESGLPKKTVFASLDNLFYSNTTTTGSDVRLPEFDKGGFNPNIRGDVYVINVSQQTFGEQLRPGTFTITTGAGSGSISDDGLGRLYCNTAPTTIVGNIFYPLGIAVVSKMSSTGPETGSIISHQGMYLTTGSTIIVNYNSQLTIYEYTIICTLERDEFNFSSNPSLSLFSTSSVAGASGSKMLDAMGSGSLTPYITTIGLYNDNNEMVAIAKVPRAIRRTPEMDQTFIIRFDA